MAEVTLPAAPAPLDAPARPGPRSAAWPDLAVATVLYVLAALWFRSLAAAASAQGVLLGEEASVGHRDGMAIAMEWQASIWSTNAAGQAFYWAAGHLLPDYGLLSVRPAKAVATALLVPLVYAVLRRRLGATRPAAVVGAPAVATLPGLSMLAWVAFETPLDTVVGAAAMYVVTSRRAWWPAGLVLAGLTVSTYTAGLAWAAACLVVAVVRIRTPASAGLVLAGVLGGLAAVFWPLLWWDNGGRLVTGGGVAGPDPGAAGDHLTELLRYLAVDGESYYYFSDLPMLGSFWLAVALLAALVVAAVARPREMAPWLLVGLAATGLYAVSSGVPGSRRVVALVVVAALGAGVATDLLVRAARRHAGAGLAVALAAVALLLVTTPSVTGTLDWRRDTVAGISALPQDWPLRPDPGRTQEQTLARLDADLRRGALTPREVGDGWGGTRVLGLLFLLAERNGRTPPVRPDDVIAYFYRPDGDCRGLGDC